MGGCLEGWAAKRLSEYFFSHAIAPSPSRNPSLSKTKLMAIAEFIVGAGRRPDPLAPPILRAHQMQITLTSEITP
jgi:hypothetical protein